MSSAFGEFDDATRRVVEPNALAHGVGKYRAQQADGATGNTTATAHDRETAWLGLLLGGRLADSDVVHEAFDVAALTAFTGSLPSRGMTCRMNTASTEPVGASAPPGMGTSVASDDGVQSAAVSPEDATVAQCS